ncbi:hypothetical protein K7I13_06670 [Brucepastera parasyntrophica]|uniref:hypothetical protein n=1 Tax=Brucepastera parasyntrophica TaxID=2880008 RepID=UPI00210E5DC4|nr:hypothetical protein [Brucepastera parasyntrophica]ULQ60933.1 hypothetical protein K7I13_06670 [Brucepastera parasyntrophica]
MSSIPTDLAVLLRLYAGKQNNPNIVIQDFCEYLQKYARHYIEQEPELVIYLADTASTVQIELEKLQDKGRVVLSSDPKSRNLVFVPQFFVDKMTQWYKRIEERPEVPFPLVSELPENFPVEVLRQILVSAEFLELLETGERSNNFLYQLNFPDEIPALVYPGSILPDKMLTLALAKIRYFLRKDESRDYIQKRLSVTNPGREMVVKKFLFQFQMHPSDALADFKKATDTYIFWSSVCGFIKQDYGKKNEKTPEENALLQAVLIIEHMNYYFKSKAQQSIQRETALKNLALCFQKAPYYFDMNAITGFIDSRGVPLLGQYSETDLDDFLKSKTAQISPEALPEMLVFKTENSGRYFILKDRIPALIIHLCNENRKKIKEFITQEWLQILMAYGQDEAMKNQQAFEKKLEALCKTVEPVLHGLLTAPFIQLMAREDLESEKANPGKHKVFEHGRLLPYSTLLMLNRQELLTDTRIMLPFWYTIPIISSIIAFFRRPKKKKRKKSQVQQTSADVQVNENQHESRHHSSHAEMKTAVEVLEKQLVPKGSTIENEMKTQLDAWNKNLNPEARQNLTHDVNALIKDYMRKVLKTLKASSFDQARIQNLAKTLVETPSLNAIRNSEALLVYVQLYILLIVKKNNMA